MQLPFFRIRNFQYTVGKVLIVEQIAEIFIDSIFETCVHQTYRMRHVDLHFFEKFVIKFGKKINEISAKKTCCSVQFRKTNKHWRFSWQIKRIKFFF